jgi:archaeosine synthase beta-subunit
VTILHPSRYPEGLAERDRWIIERRGPRYPVQVDKPYAFLIEEERFENGEIGNVATLFLTNRECPWHCAMCDLWRNTLTETVPLGAIPAQITYALDRLPRARQIKLYNSGSFFDRGAIPREDYEAIADLVSRFERVIVECHPSLIGDSYEQFRTVCSRPLEVAMGLETAHPDVLAKLNKRMTLDQYVAAAHRLHSDGVDLRSFVLVQPPFMREEDSLEWASRSIDFAFDCGATVVSLLPTRPGNGAVDALATIGLFAPPDLHIVEDALDYGVALGKGRVFVDLWDINRVVCCSDCQGARVERLRRINYLQVVLERVGCETCGGHS